jgi:hypothetical protein
MRTISLSSTVSSEVAYLLSPRMRGRLNHPIGCFDRAHVVGAERAELVVAPGKVLGHVDDHLTRLPPVYALPSPRRQSISLAALPRSPAVRKPVVQSHPGRGSV